MVRKEGQLYEVLPALRQLLRGEKNLNCPTTDEYLARFIKASNYDAHLSYQLVKDHFKARLNHPEEFAFGAASDYAKVISRIELGFVLQDHDCEGRRIMLLRLGDLDPGVEDWETLMQSAALVLEAYSLEPSFQDSGACLVVDCTNFSLKIMKWATPYKLKVIMTFLQEAIPVRFEIIHIVNAPLVFNIFFSAIKPFMTDNFLQKLQWHKAPYTKLHSLIDPALIPKWLGGTLDLDSVKDWHKDVIDKEDILEEYSRYGYKKDW